MDLHEFLDEHYGADGDKVLIARLKQGEDIEQRRGLLKETPLHVAMRRYRPTAVGILLDHGADINSENGGGKTVYAHAVRRQFSEIAELLVDRGARTDLNVADQFAVAVVQGNLEEAKAILAKNPEVARTGNPEEDRLLADMAGRNSLEPVQLLIDAGADLEATALDSGTALHQAAWFGQPENARVLIAAGAPLDWFDATHNSSPLHWAVHGSRFSGGADERQENYVALVEMLLDAGSSIYYPDQPDSDAYKTRLLKDATDAITPILEQHFS